jgi:hypothetical protein
MIKYQTLTASTDWIANQEAIISYKAKYFPNQCLIQVMLLQEIERIAEGLHNAKHE